MARKDIPSGKKPKPLTKKERKERKKKRRWMGCKILFYMYLFGFVFRFWFNFW